MPELGRPACDRHQTRSTLEWTTLKPFDNPLGTRLSPMSQVRSVTYVSGLDNQLRWRSQQNKQSDANQQLALAHPHKLDDCTAKASKGIGSSELTAQRTMMSFPTSGFQDKGATWVGEELYYFSNSTGIRFKPDATHPDTLLVVYPDGTLSAHSYNLARAKQHCRDLARAIYPRQTATAPAFLENDVAGKLGGAVDASKLDDALNGAATAAVVYGAPETPHYAPPIGRVEVPPDRAAEGTHSAGTHHASSREQVPDCLSDDSALRR